MRSRSFLDRPTFDSAEGVFFGFELDAYRDFIAFGESNIEKESQQLERQFEEFQDDVKSGKSKIDIQYLDYVENNYYDEFGKIDYDFRQNLRRSQIIMLYSFLESKLKEGCNSYAKAHNKKNTIGNLKGQSDLDKIKLFIKRSMGIKIDDLNPEWNYLNNVRVVRNKIVHHNGLIKKSDKDFNKIEKFSKNHFDLVLIDEPDNYLIELNHEDFLKEVISNISKLYHNIIDLEVEQLKASKN